MNCLHSFDRNGFHNGIFPLPHHYMYFEVTSGLKIDQINTFFSKEYQITIAKKYINTLYGITFIVVKNVFTTTMKASRDFNPLPHNLVL